MKADNIPNSIFDSLLTRPFASLTSKEQEEVLLHFSEEEYTAMHEAASGLSTIGQRAKAKGKDAIKASLMDAFDAQYPVNKPAAVWMNYRLSLPQAAAIILLCLSGLIAFYQLNPREKIVYKESVRIDTLIAEAGSPEQILIHDTVWQKVEVEQLDKTQKPSKRTLGIISPGQQELYIQGAENINASVNQTKNNSLEQDTLVSRIGFVTM